MRAGFGLGLCLIFLLTCGAGCMATPLDGAAPWPERDREVYGPVPEREDGSRAGVPWRNNHPHRHFQATIGIGTVRHETFGPPVALDDDTTAVFLRLATERGEKFGGGFRATVLLGEDGELHGTSDHWSADLFGHFTAVVRGGRRFRMPIRVGPFAQFLFVENLGLLTNPVEGEDVSTLLLGVRVDIEPEVHIVLTDTIALSWFLHLFGGIGTAYLTDGDEGFETDGTTGGISSGLRFNARRFHASIAFAARRTSIDDAQDDGFRVQEADYTFEGVLLTIGTRW